MPVDDRQDEEAADQEQRDPVGDRHGEQVARGRECHQRRKQQQPDRIGNHDRPTPVPRLEHLQNAASTPLR